MELSDEDALRLNVLVSTAEAVRIDESAMAVYGLQGEREMRIQLNPTGREEKYLSLVRQMLSGAILGSPGGYPVFLRRWTRTGEITHVQLDKLLMLGEPEAVLAVARSATLTDELARRAWWAAPDSEVARQLLENPAVAGMAVGREVAEYLLEYLPFETEHRDMVETVRLVLAPGLIDGERRQRLWESGRSKKAYRLGFLVAAADALPETVPARADVERDAEALTGLAKEGNPYATLLKKTLGSPGQSFLEAAAEIIRRPPDQDVVSLWLNAVGGYFATLRREPEELREIGAIEQAVDASLREDQAAALLATCPALRRELGAALFLAHVDEAVVTPIFALTDAVGTVMRKKIEPVVTPILEQFAVLRGT